MSKTMQRARSRGSIQTIESPKRTSKNDLRRSVMIPGAIPVLNEKVLKKMKMKKLGVRTVSRMSNASKSKIDLR